MYYTTLNSGSAAFPDLRAQMHGVKRRQRGHGVAERRQQPAAVRRGVVCRVLAAAASCRAACTGACRPTLETNAQTPPSVFKLWGLCLHILPLFGRRTWSCLYMLPMRNDTKKTFTLINVALSFAGCGRSNHSTCRTLPGVLHKLWSLAAWPLETTLPQACLFKKIGLSCIAWRSPEGRVWVSNALRFFLSRNRGAHITQNLY